jgi:hypothetical protein
VNRAWRSDCPYCGQIVGIVGNWLAVLFGTRIHGCPATRVPTEEK